MPAFIAAWRAGFWPTPAVSTWPITTSETCSAGTPARSRTFLMTIAPRSDAGVFAKAPPNLPIGVRAAPTMKMSSMEVLLDPLPDVAAGRRLDYLVLDTSRLRRCPALAARMPLEPFVPGRPPAALLLVGGPEPVVGLFRIRRTVPVAAPVLRRRIDH